MLLKMSETILKRRVDGWVAFQPDEKWEYVTERDGNECHFCQKEEYSSPHDGNMIPDKFPDWGWEKYPKEIMPHYHIQLQSRGIRGLCRCHMYWVDMLPLLTDRLGMELAEL